MSDLFQSPSFELSSAVFSILSGLIEDKAGLHYSLLDREILQEKATYRAQEAGFTSLLDYYYFLRYDPKGALEINDLIESLVVNETYFFREWPAIQVLVESCIAPMCAKGLRPRIWSAACSTGEEPLSIAMLLDEHHLLDKVDLVASDISLRALSRPQRGKYGKRSVRQTPFPKLVETYLQAEDDGYRVKSHLVEKIQWKNLNLLEQSNIAVLGTFDVILCRNVLIYFSDTTVKTVLNHLYGALQPDGTLIVGVSESLLRYGSGFIGEEHRGAFLYKKKTDS